MPVSLVPTMVPIVCPHLQQAGTLSAGLPGFDMISQVCSEKELEQSLLLEKLNCKWAGGKPVTPQWSGQGPGRATAHEEGSGF
jgi:hypothetical protein